MATDSHKSSEAEETDANCPVPEKTKEFKQFDIVTNCSDHHFIWLNKPSKDGLNCDQLKIMQEWKILEQNLPESIFVRVYEERIDLLRAAIIGAAGTPYHDSLFFFDLAFPSDYPNQPPKVHYHSHNLSLNPNLYSGGYVCLSLLNTWSGKKTQKWNPSQSTILQVLLSLQALVLNEKPYFNEPGVNPGRPIWEKESMEYTEDVFLLSCKTMLCLLEKPPQNFEDFVAEHFRHRAEVILTACKAYTDGVVRVGYFYVDEGSSSSSTVEVSRKFKLSMQKLFPDLVEAFARNGASVWNYFKPTRKKMISSKDRAIAKKKKYKFTRNLIGKWKWMLGLKKFRKKLRSTAV
ncbi:probable ubiquitin-conjugating enzyme E2 24 [Malania oleifera]|uniref:probable ubiquitin-conjugating enzyme E2 24 n=1 Tax=Malania oleifera TaxID=397392 RepID=UPI0025AE3D14|nr:probable ubiquitin-conjugating enzyme E2 24 [Malania oleifera]